MIIRWIINIIVIILAILIFLFLKSKDIKIFHRTGSWILIMPIMLLLFVISHHVENIFMNFSTIENAFRYRD